MNSIQRQTVLTQRRRTAALAAAETTALRDEPIRHTDVPRRGLARIVSNDANGEYTITEQWWDPEEEEWTNATAPLGYVEADARDWQDSEAGQADELAPFWEHRGLEGELQLFIDAAGAWSGKTRTASFVAHYSGTNTTGAFYSVPDCLNALVEVGLDVRRCSANGSPTTNHPGYRTFGTSGGQVGYGWCNALATWSGGGGWEALKYHARQSNGAYEGDGVEGIIDFRIECSMTAAGALQFRIDNQAAAQVSVLIVAAVRITPFAESPPGTLEIGNCCCHDDPDWNEYEWGQIPAE